MLQHCVFCDIRADVSQAQLQAVYNTLAGIVDQVPGMRSFQSGINRDYEGKSPNYRHGFICTFDDRTAHLAYEQHPDHKAAGAALVALCTNGYDGIVVFDLEV